MKRGMCLLLGMLLALLAPVAALAQDAPLYERAVRLQRGMPALRFAVYADAASVPEYPDDPACRVVITREDGSALPELRFGYLGGAEMVELLRFHDFNFDGYLDVEALYVPGATNVTCTYFLYDPQADAFAPCPALSELSAYELYPQQKLIYNSIHDSAATGVWQLYAVENGQPRLIRQVSALYDEATNFEDVRVIATEYAADGAASERLNEPVTWEQLNDPATYNAWGAMLWSGYDADESPAAECCFVNPEGGVHYHMRADCPSVSEKFWPGMRRVDEAEWNEGGWDALTPCEFCCHGKVKP